MPAATVANGRLLLRSFADVLDYPTALLADPVADCELLALAESAEAAELLREFRAFVADQPLGRLQEIYTGAFDLDTLSDLNPTCYPYVGHHLFGESHKRSAFLVGLHERFRAHGFAAENELADHLVVLLRFAAACDDAVLVEELVGEAMLPALRRMAGPEEAADDDPGAPSGRERYQRVLRALALVLEAQFPSDQPPAEDLAAGRSDA